MKLRTLENTRVLILEPENNNDFLSIGIMKGKLRDKVVVYPTCSDRPSEARMDFSDAIALMAATN